MQMSNPRAFLSHCTHARKDCVPQRRTACRARPGSPECCLSIGPLCSSLLKSSGKHRRASKTPEVWLLSLSCSLSPCLLAYFLNFPESPQFLPVQPQVEAASAVGFLGFSNEPDLPTPNERDSLCSPRSPSSRLRHFSSAFPV